MLEAIWLEIMEKELSLSLAIYEYANIGNEDFFVTVNDKAKRRWISLLQYGMDSGEFKNVDAQQVADLILYYYQGLRMWSRVVPFDKREADNYVNSIRQILLPNIEWQKWNYKPNRWICKHKFADKEIYSITDKGRVYFKELMAFYAAGPIPLLFDFNVVITNLNKMDKAEAMELVSTLRQSIQSSAELNEGYAQEFPCFFYFVRYLPFLK